MTTPDDPVVKQYRDQISDIDLQVIALLNRRLEVVDLLWRYKAEHDIPMYVPEREAQMVEFLTGANRGPLSAEGLREVYRSIVETTKAEAARLAAD